MKYLTVVFLIVLVSFAQAKLKAYNADINQTSVSGISAGGFMAVQFQVAYSKTIVGAGVIAGGPYFCAKGQLIYAVEQCMSNPGAIDLSVLKKDMLRFQTKKQIDNLDNLKNANIYLYSGTKDTVVRPGVMEHLKEQLESLDIENIKSNFNTPSEHAWITQDFGNKCDFKGEPYINNCNLNIPLNIMKHIYGNGLKFNALVKAKAKNLIQFDQTPYLKEGDSMNDTGYLYVPTKCHLKTTQCKVHIAFHGCEQTIADIGIKFVQHSGLNAIAEQNNIIVLYPQAKKSSYAPLNPKGCFDWWGYSDNEMFGVESDSYATKMGSQMTSIWNMLNDLTGQNQGYNFFE